MLTVLQKDNIFCIFVHFSEIAVSFIAWEKNGQALKKQVSLHIFPSR